MIGAICTILTVATAVLISTASGADSAAEKRVKTASKEPASEGFKIREDFWKGELKGGDKKIVKHQLFRGNEYWFWLGADAAGIKLAIKVYDSMGRPVDVETRAESGWSAVRVLPPKTDTYSVVFTLADKSSPMVVWAMTYGYR